MSTQLEASVQLINSKIKLSGTAGTNPHIDIDYIPPFGDGEGYMPLQLLLMSLAACSLHTCLLLLRKGAKTVTDFKARAEGTRREKHPTSFTDIKLFFDLISPDTSDEEFLSIIKVSEEKLCPVWDMLKSKVEISFEYTVSKDRP